MITVLDYGAGNVRSVINAVEHIGEKVKVATAAEDILSAEKLIFPGVGAFGSMMSILNDKNLTAPLKAYLDSNRPFLGICLGMQAMLEKSAEAPGMKGLGLFPGETIRFKTDLAVPHIGWNKIHIKQPSAIFNGLSGKERFYFVHSFHIVPADDNDILTTTDYGSEFASGSAPTIPGIWWSPRATSMTSGKTEM